MKTVPIVQDRTGSEGNERAERALPPSVQAALGDLAGPPPGCSKPSSSSGA